MICPWIVAVEWHPSFALTLWPFRGKLRSTDDNDLWWRHTLFSNSGAPYGDLMRRFRILHPFTIYMCRNEVTEVTVGILRDNWSFLAKKWIYEFWPPKWSVGGGVKYSALYSTDHMTCFSLWIAMSDPSLLREQVIGEIAFWTLVGLWPVLRGHRLTKDLGFLYHLLCVVISNTLVFIPKL